MWVKRLHKFVNLCCALWDPQKKRIPLVFVPLLLMSPRQGCFYCLSENLKYFLCKIFVWNIVQVFNLNAMGYFVIFFSYELNVTFFNLALFVQIFWRLFNFLFPFRLHHYGITIVTQWCSKFQKPFHITNSCDHPSASGRKLFRW